MVLAIIAAGLLLWQRPWHDDTRSSAEVASLPADASTRLTRQLRSLTDAGSEVEFLDAIGDLPAAQEFGRRTWKARQAVAAPGASFRYISGGEVADRADGSAIAVAEISWRPSEQSGLDPDVTHRSTVELRVAPQDDGTFSVTGAGSSGSTVPLWLLGDVTVTAGDGRALIRVDGGDRSLPVDEMTAAARTAVERVAPGGNGELTVISARTQAQMAAIVGQPQDAVAQIAAITTGIDGDSTTDDAVVVLNPAVFATMDRRAAQVVLSHEATHVLTGAVGSTAVNWVVEGFADYVALRDDTAPLSVSAGQALAEVRAGRIPQQLPDDADFESTRHGLGAVYESAWMIFRMLGRDYDDAQILGFYRDVVDGTPVDRALDTAFGLTTEQLTARWRGYLTKSASTVS